MHVVVTIGLPGCGKTTWLLETYGHEPHVLVSADRARHSYCAGHKFPVDSCNRDSECSMTCSDPPHPRAPYTIIGAWLSGLFADNYDGHVLIDTTGATRAQRRFLYAAAGVGEPGVTLTLAIFAAGPRNLPRKRLARRRQLDRAKIKAIWKAMEQPDDDELALADEIIRPTRTKKRSS